MHRRRNSRCTLIPDTSINRSHSGTVDMAPLFCLGFFFFISKSLYARSTICLSGIFSCYVHTRVWKKCHLCYFLDFFFEMSSASRWTNRTRKKKWVSPSFLSCLETQRRFTTRGNRNDNSSDFKMEQKKGEELGFEKGWWRRYSPAYFSCLFCKRIIPGASSLIKSSPHDYSADVTSFSRPRPVCVKPLTATSLFISCFNTNLCLQLHILLSPHHRVQSECTGNQPIANSCRSLSLLRESKSGWR